MSMGPSSWSSVSWLYCQSNSTGTIVRSVLTFKVERCASWQLRRGNFTVSRKLLTGVAFDIPDVSILGILQRGALNNAVGRRNGASNHVAVVNQ